MKCAWEDFLSLVPGWLRKDVDRLGAGELQELRLRLSRPPEIVSASGGILLNGCVRRDDLEFSVNIASRYSAWTAATQCSGYITASGGHRVGICGEAVCTNGSVTAMTNLTSVSIRAARDFPGIAADLSRLEGSILILGRPGTGKTTLLRDLVRVVSCDRQENVGVVDERKEIFPLHDGVFCFDPGERTDVLSGCPKRLGVEMLLRTMTPRTIAVDEITNEDDAMCLIKAGGCGATLIATIHAAGFEDLFNRHAYQALIKARLFQHAVILNEEQSWNYERMNT